MVSLPIIANVFLVGYILLDSLLKSASMYNYVFQLISSPNVSISMYRRLYTHTNTDHGRSFPAFTFIYIIILYCPPYYEASAPAVFSSVMVSETIIIMLYIPDYSLKTRPIKIRPGIYCMGDR